MSIGADLFYAPGDWLAQQTSVRQRRALGAWVLIFWLGPGSILSLLWPRSVLYIELMSLFALQITCWTLVGTETPIEEESAAL